MLEILKCALVKNTPVEMIYMSKNGIISQRIVNVNEMTEHNVKCYCHLRKRIRTFKHENILAVLPFNQQKRKYVS